MPTGLEIAASNKGATAAATGVSYHDNPYCKVQQPNLYLIWSQAHNSMRAKILRDQELGVGK